MAKKKDKKNKQSEILNPMQGPFIKVKDKNLSLEERIYALPPYTHDFNMNRQYQLEKAGLWEKYEQEFILTMYVEDYDFDTGRKIDHTYVGVFNEEIEKQYLNINRVSISKRSNVEYQPGPLQIISGCIITSPSFIAVLKSTAGRLEGKLTMAQGHVDYDPSFVLCKDLTSYVRKNAIRELSEEVKIKDGNLLDDITVSEKPKYVINKYGSLIDIEHIGFVFEATMSDEDILKLKSNEKDKHDIFIVNKESLIEEGVDAYPFDSWTEDVMTMIISE